MQRDPRAMPSPRLSQPSPRRSSPRLASGSKKGKSIIRSGTVAYAPYQRPDYSPKLLQNRTAGSLLKMEPEQLEAWADHVIGVGKMAKAKAQSRKSASEAASALRKALLDTMPSDDQDDPSENILVSQLKDTAKGLPGPSGKFIQRSARAHARRALNRKELELGSPVLAAAGKAKVYLD